jgi:multidrug transporter EmrE-like cation transporter
MTCRAAGITCPPRVSRLQLSRHLEPAVKQTKRRIGYLLWHMSGIGLWLMIGLLVLRDSSWWIRALCVVPLLGHVMYLSKED